MSWPIAWFITWTTYGTWLHGDARGSFRDDAYIPANAEVEKANRTAMAGDAITLPDRQRVLVSAAIVAECQAQGWELHEHNVRTNHVHLVVSAARPGAFVRARLKAVAAKVLSDDAGLPAVGGSDGRKRWWTEKGNVIPVETERALHAICVYVRDLQ